MKNMVMMAILAVGATQPAFAQSAFGEEAKVDEVALGRVAGREDVNQLAFSQQTNNVSNNNVGNNSTTGAVQIDGNAFQNLTGLSVISANSGNNVAINSALTVNISLAGVN